MKNLLNLSLLFLFTACSNPAQEQSQDTETEDQVALQFAEPSEVGLSLDSLKKIDELIKGYVDNHHYPGAVVLIAKDGKIVYETEVGWSDSAQTEPYRKDHIFRMASMTKPLTSVAAMQLIEEGKLNLDDPISKYIPEFANPTVITNFNPQDTTWESRPAHREPTVKHLLNHTAGVPYGFIAPSLYGAILAKNNIPDLATHQDVTIGEKAAVLGKLPLAHDPAEKWMYGLNTDVLGRVVEVASDMTLGEYIKEHITKPLRMTDTDFFLNEEQSQRLVDVYFSNADSTISYLKADPSRPLFHPDYPSFGAKKYFSGGSGMSGTARDYYVFAQMMLNDGIYGNDTILSAQTAQMMHQNQIDTLAFPMGPAKFGFGFAVFNGHPIRPDGTYSWSGAFATNFWIDPKNDLIVIVLSQVLFPADRSLNLALERATYNSLIEN